MRFSMIEIKTFLYILITHFVFKPSPKDRIIKSNVYVSSRFPDHAYTEEQGIF